MNISQTAALADRILARHERLVLGAMMTPLGEEYYTPNRHFAKLLTVAAERLGTSPRQSGLPFHSEQISPRC